MSLSAAQEDILNELEALVETYADKELKRLTRRANLLRRMNTRVDDFEDRLETEQVRRSVIDITSVLS